MDIGDEQRCLNILGPWINHFYAGNQQMGYTARVDCRPRIHAKCSIPSGFICFAKL